MDGIVVLEDDTVRIQDLRLTNPEVVQHFRQIEEPRRVDIAVRAFELGVFCLERAQLGGSLDYVRLQVERLITEVTTAISGVPEDLRTKLEVESGPLKALKEKADEVKTLFDQHLDLDRPEATLGKALSTLKGLLDPKYEDSVQSRIQAALDSIAAVDGKLAQAVKKAVEDGTNSLSTTVEDLQNTLVMKKGEEEVISRTPEKGFEFEEEIKPLLEQWTATVGADAPDHVGPQNLPGDFVITLKDTTVAVLPLKIIVEARDRESGWGRARISDQMKLALNQRISVSSGMMF